MSSFQEKTANTVQRRVVGEQHPIHHEMVTKFDHTNNLYLFSQPCGILNVECHQSCGYAAANIESALASILDA